VVNSKEILFWSIAFPGFGQILNGKLVKGFILVGLEILINVQANFNKAIILSFNGEIESAIQQTDYQWLMFYPCLYFFSMWDAFKDAGGAKDPLLFLPFVFAGFFVTAGLIYSAKIRLFGVLLGPIWLPVLFMFFGLGVGFIIKLLIEKKRH